MARLNTAVPVAAQAPAVNTAAVITLAAAAAAEASRWSIYDISWSYSGTPTGGSITIAWTDANGAHSIVYYIIAGGPGQLTLDKPFEIPIDTAATITLAAGGGGIFGTLYASCWQE